MQKLKSLLVRLVRDEDGASAAEYAILVSLVAAAVVLAVQQFDLGTLFGNVSTKVKTLAA